jgi:hypothetical protein
VDVYVAGTEFNGYANIARYWKNGKAVSLTDSTADAYAEAIVIVGSDVYVTGSEYMGSFNNNVVKYWKNGICLQKSYKPLNLSLYHNF